MKKKIILNLIILVFALFININTTKSLAKYQVALNKCVDGDTAYFNYEDKILKTRFLAIDTPESTNQIEPYGKKASTYTCDMLTNAEKIYLEKEENSTEVDKYGRYLFWIWTDEDLLQEKLVSEGLAEVKYLYGDYKYTSLLEEKQIEAKKLKLNIWSDIDETDNTYYEFLYLILVLVIIVIRYLKKK